MSNKAIEWTISPEPVLYPDALTRMEERVQSISRGEASEWVWLLEHPPLYTAGTSANPSDLLDPRFPVFSSGRGGQYTYHGPGQRIAYVMLDLSKRGSGIKKYVCQLEKWMIKTLEAFGIQGERRAGRVGIWVRRQPEDNLTSGEDKIAAIGIRIRRWVSFHGVALNVCPDLSHFSGIVPCGIRDHGVTSLQALGIKTSLSDVDQVLKKTFFEVFRT